MALNLIPKEVKFFDYLTMQAETGVKAIECLKQAVKTGAIDDEVVKKLRDFEHEGDTLAHEIVDMLNRTFITPLDREDIYALANILDDVTDLVNAITNRMRLYRLSPADEYFTQFIDTLEQSVAALSNAVTHLHDSKRQRRVLDYCIEINRLENIGDQVREKAIGRLFEREKDPMMVIKWKEIYEMAEGALDTCEHVAKMIESVMVKNG